MSILELNPSAAVETEPAVTTADDRVARFGAIYDANYADIDAYCRRRTAQAQAADAVSETFLTAWRRFDDMPTGESARLWLFGVARRVIANQQRSTNRRDRLHLRLVDQPHTTAAPADAHLDAEPVVEALASLSTDDAEVLRLVAWEGLSHAEAGVVLDCTANAIGVRVHRARQRLARALETNEQTDRTDRSEP